MIDELDLAFEDQDRTERWRHRRRRGGGKGKPSKRRRGRSFVALVLTVVLLGALGAGGWYGYGKVKGFFIAPDYTTGGSGEVSVEIKTGDTLTDMANTLYRADVVKSAKAFLNACDDDERSQNIQPGFYKLRHQMRAKDALAMMLDLDNKLVTKVTVPEGMITVDIYAALANASGLPLKQFQDAAKDAKALGVPDYWFKRDDGKEVAKNLEGFLYPATYEFDPGTTAKQMLEAMVAKFNTEMERLDFPDTIRNKLSISPYEGLIVASIAQAEAVLDKDMGMVSRVLYNRAYSDNFTPNYLGLDSAVNYWKRLQGDDVKASEHLTNSDLHDSKNPYNTHDVEGLPLGPISNPGESALQGAMNPPKSNNVYFVTIDDKGTMAYATTLDGHNRNIQKACQNGIPLC